MAAHCYCFSPDEGLDTEMLKCDTCGQYFHSGCLKTGRPSPLKGDVFFLFICQTCSPTGTEQVKRLHMPWLPVIVLTLYNLQLSGTGMLGYFRWKEHICAFIETHWTVFFASKKKPVNIGGTVAGALSLWNNVYFKSGSHELQQSGWWKLLDCSPPSIDLLTVTRAAKNNLPAHSFLSDNRNDGKSERLRNKAKKPSIAVAMELKAKRDLSATNSSASKKRKSLVTLNQGGSTNSSKQMYKDTTKISDNHFLGNSAPDDISDSSTLVADQSIASYATGDSFWSLPMESNYVELEAFNSVGSSPTSWLTDQDPILDFGQGSIPDFIMKDDESSADVLSNLDSTFTMTSDLDNIEPALSPSHLHSSSAADQLENLQDILSSVNWSDKRIIGDVNDSMGSNVHTFRSSVTNARSGSESSGDKLQQATSAADSASDDENDVGNDDASSDNESHIDSDNSRSICEKKVKRKKNLNLNRPRKYRRRDDVDEVKEDPKPKLQMMSVYEEKQLLKFLNSNESFVDPGSEAYRLRCKLRVRQIKRERGLPVFDLDQYMRSLLHSSTSSHSDARGEKTLALQQRNIPLENSTTDSERRILDRYHSQSSDKQSSSLPYDSNTSQSLEPVSFRSRLMGNEEGRLPLIYSPYTTRILKPYIRRCFETKPTKLLLLEEIVAYSHRNDAAWKPPAPHPLDFCYVRPKHIPAINSLCQQFFWPGINLSDCLQYPDNSCVVLYRQLIVGFAFMVPDVRYNESYISFIFTHPDWRRAGIATFMLYHLIQTSPGKDVTLHVSSSNPAVLLYQKFVFKTEEFIMDFYDKYFSADSRDCRHAFFMRLRR